jgi:hypothetical protein
VDDGLSTGCLRDVSPMATSPFSRLVCRRLLAALFPPAALALVGTQVVCVRLSVMSVALLTSHFFVTRVTAAMTVL